MKGQPRPEADPLQRAIELALRPEAFIPDGACFTFVHGLEGVAAQIARLVKTDPARALALHETFLAGCYAKADEVDDSSDTLGQFIVELYLGWIRSRQAAGADPDRTATRLLAWVDKDPYGFADRVETRAAEVMNKAGRVAYEQAIRARFDATANQGAVEDDAVRNRTAGQRRRFSAVLRSIYLAQKRIAPYVALAEETGVTAQDCHAIATMLAARRRTAEALAWVERGIDLQSRAPIGAWSFCDLGGFRKQLLVRLNRASEAIDLAWAEYQSHLSTYSYDNLMTLVPEAERARWHQQAVDAINGADLDNAIVLLLHTKEWGRLADRVRQSRDAELEGLSHTQGEPAASQLETTHPELAARLWRAQGLRIVNAKKSKYYDAALSYFDHAKSCFERAGLATEWANTVEQVRAAHQRKAGFMPGFEDVVAGIGPSHQPTFLERAKERWIGWGGGTD